MADGRQQPEPCPEKVDRVLEPPETAEKAGAGSGAEVRLWEPPKGPMPLNRVARQATRLEAGVAVTDLTRGKRGHARPRQVTAHAAAHLPTAPGGIPGDTGLA